MPVCPLEPVQADALGDAISPDAYLWRSIALPFLRRWLALFPRERLLILTHAALVCDPRATLRRAMGFLGLADGMPDCGHAIKTFTPPPMSPNIERRLRDWFAPHQAALAPLLAELGVEP